MHTARCVLVQKAVFVIMSTQCFESEHNTIFLDTGAGAEELPSSSPK